MLPRPADPGQTDAAQAQAAHESGEQNAERDRGRPNGELKKLIPDDLVNQRGEAAARKQDEQERKKAGGVLVILHGTESHHDSRGGGPGLTKLAAAWERALQ